MSSFGFGPSKKGRIADASMMTVDVRTGRSHRLTDRRTDGADPLPEAVVFSPDGRWIAFMRRLPAAAPHNQIFIVAAAAVLPKLEK